MIEIYYIISQILFITFLVSTPIFLVNENFLIKKLDVNFLDKISISLIFLINFLFLFSIFSFDIKYFLYLYILIFFFLLLKKKKEDRFQKI